MLVTCVFADRENYLLDFSSDDEGGHEIKRVPTTAISTCYPRSVIFLAPDTEIIGVASMFSCLRYVLVQKLVK